MTVERQQSFQTIGDVYVAVSDQGATPELCNKSYGDSPVCPFKNGRERFCKYPGGKIQTAEGLIIHDGVVTCPRDLVPFVVLAAKQA